MENTSNPFIQSASGWRFVFAYSCKQDDKTTIIGKEHSLVAAMSVYSFACYLKKLHKDEKITIALGGDTRPTSKEIIEVAIKVLTDNSINIGIRVLGIAAAPEIMNYAKKVDGFLYISASHNPIGFNGIKMGLNNGGVLDARQNKEVVAIYEGIKNNKEAVNKLLSIIQNKEFNTDSLQSSQEKIKKDALISYETSLFSTMFNTNNCDKIEKERLSLTQKIKETGISIVADFNGSARTLSIDKTLFNNLGVQFSAINDKPGEIVHGILPEKENLLYVASAVEERAKNTTNKVILGYMCDCDGDRGNLVYYDFRNKSCKVLEAQEVFLLSVLGEFLYQYRNCRSEDRENRIGVVCNCATSYRVERLAAFFGAKVIRCEVGEAAVVDTIIKERKKGLMVNIGGEGSNGGVILYPFRVRDPLNTLFILLRLLTDKEYFSLWCRLTGSFYQDKEGTIENYLASLPQSLTTETGDKEASLYIQTKDLATLRRRMQNYFTNEWNKMKDYLYKEYQVIRHEVRLTYRSEELRNVADWSIYPTGGLKILFFNAQNEVVFFLWGRASGTEPLFRVMIDVEGNSERSVKLKEEGLEWFRKIITASDRG